MVALALIRKLFGSRNERVLKGLKKSVDAINLLESKMQALSDEELQAQTPHLKQRLAQGESLNDILPEAFATMREASKRILGMRHFDVQLLGGMVLHQGNIAEMRTGEGKTLVATLPAYLNALTEKGVHVITVNDYLAKRDLEWMEPVYHFLGLRTGLIISELPSHERKKAYAADIIYGTNNEFGFDYLRDNMAFSLADKVQRELHYAIVDEVDSILIDEARTPLIISGATDENPELYYVVNGLIPLLKKQVDESQPGDFTVDEKTRQAYLTESGHQHIEELCRQRGLIQADESLYDVKNITLMHFVSASLRAHHLYQKDVDYIVKDGEVVIIDEHTGRTMPGRRWSDGLHQAIEAKENVNIQNENQTLASITFQNYFRLYEKLAGMTGTADTEAYEFQQIYNLEVVVMPTNLPVRRTDLTDQVYLTAKEKFNAIILDIEQRVQKKQPILVGTASIEASEHLSQLLAKRNIKHQVLNAKYHEKEAHIIANAGRPGAVTIATNMAGRGTDIVLGGHLKSDIAALMDPTEAQIAALKESWQKMHDEVVEAGGLHIIGSERHESRRIDNQLRGRAGRQGDPGSSRFYLSLEDNLLRIFASDRVSAIMQRLGLKEGEAIEHAWVNKAIENAQRKVESYYFDIRKQLLEYDNVANDQRKVIYSQRDELLAEEDLSSTIEDILTDVIEGLTERYIPHGSVEEEWDVPGLEQQLASDFSINMPIGQWLKENEELQVEDLYEKIREAFLSHYQNKCLSITAPIMRQLEKSILLQSLDQHWREHLAAMDHLRQGIHLRGYAQKNPKQEYKREAFAMFQAMLDAIKRDVVSVLMRVQMVSPDDVQAAEERRRHVTDAKLEFKHAELSEGEEQASDTGVSTKVGRNEACPCGSGKKYKHCHGRMQ